MILTFLWALNSSYARIKAKYCLQMYNRIIISNFPQNLIIISQFLSFFSLFFQFFNFGHFRTISYPPDPCTLRQGGENWSKVMKQKNAHLLNIFYRKGFEVNNWAFFVLWILSNFPHLAWVCRGVRFKGSNLGSMPVQS